MAGYFSQLEDYLTHQADLHHVDPLLFGCLYVLSKILMVIFLGWAVKNLRGKRPILLPLIFAILGYSLPYLYLIIAGKNIPLWIFLMIGVIYLFSGWSIRRKILASRASLKNSHVATPNENETDKHFQKFL